jgi:pimeloyl-ACP methyl ester carboxylesterase
MHRWIGWLVAVICLALPALAQAQKPSFDSLNQKALDAIVAKKYDDGLGFLKQALEVRPKYKGTAYNLACVYSLKNEVDAAHDWLSTASDWGWGSGRGSIHGQDGQLSEIEMCRADADLANLRKDPRFEALITKMQVNVEKRAALNKQIKEFAAKPAVYVPEAVMALAHKPVLVVLHDRGSNKDAVVAGRWKAIADELGFALVAPSATLPVGMDIAEGLQWFEDIATYQAQPWSLERTIGDSLAAFGKEHPVDKSKVLIAGEGYGGVVASNVAFTLPGTYKGALLVDSVLVPGLLQNKAANASKVGLKMKLLVDAAAIAPMLGSLDPLKAIEEWNKVFTTFNVAGSAASYTPDPADPKKVHKLIVEGLKALAPAASAPAAAPAEK